MVYWTQVGVSHDNYPDDNDGDNYDDNDAPPLPRVPPHVGGAGGVWARAMVAIPPSCKWHTDLQPLLTGADPIPPARAQESNCTSTCSC